MLPHGYDETLVAQDKRLLPAGYATFSDPLKLSMNSIELIGKMPISFLSPRMINPVVLMRISKAFCRVGFRVGQ